MVRVRLTGEHPPRAGYPSHGRARFHVTRVPPCPGSAPTGAEPGVAVMVARPWARKADKWHRVRPAPIWSAVASPSTLTTGGSHAAMAVRAGHVVQRTSRHRRPVDDVRHRRVISHHPADGAKGATRDRAARRLSEPAMADGARPADGGGMREKLIRAHWLHHGQSGVGVPQGGRRPGARTRTARRQSSDGRGGRPSLSEDRCRRHRRAIGRNTAHEPAPLAVRFIGHARLQGR